MLRTGVETDASVAYRDSHLAVMCGQADPDMTRAGVLGDVGDGLLHQAKDHEFGRCVELDLSQFAMNLDARLLSELTRKYF